MIVIAESPDTQQAASLLDKLIVPDSGIVLVDSTKPLNEWHSFDVRTRSGKLLLQEGNYGFKEYEVGFWHGPQVKSERFGGRYASFAESYLYWHQSGV